MWLWYGSYFKQKSDERATFSLALLMCPGGTYSFSPCFQVTGSQSAQVPRKGLKCFWISVPPAESQVKDIEVSLGSVGSDHRWYGPGS